jgi:hypothetical protein
MVYAWLSGCSWTDSEVLERERYWSKEIQQIIPEGTSIEQALSTGEYRDFEPSFSREGAVLMLILERIETGEPNCSLWYIYAEIPVVSGKTKAPGIESANVCV